MEGIWGKKEKATRLYEGYPGGSVVKNPSLPKQEMWVQSLSWEDPLDKEMATHSLFLPGKSLGQRSLAGYGSRGHKESDMTYQLNNNQVI